MNLKNLKTNLFIILSVMWILSGCSNSSSSSKLPQITDLKQAEQKAMQMFQSEPASAIPHFHALALHHQAANDHKNAGIAFLNTANIYDEHIQKTDSALHFANESLTSWTKLNDTLGIANLLKYAGYLNGENSNFEKGREQIEEAITLYQQKDFLDGIAVCYFNLSRLECKAEGYFKSLIHFNRAQTYWRDSNNYDRIFSNNIFGIKLMRAMNRPLYGEELVKENRQIMTITSILPKLREDFEKAAASLADC